MKNLILILILPISISVQSQTTFPFSIDLENIDGQTISSSTFSNDRQVLIIDFWNIHCGPCIKTFNSIRDNFDKWNLEADAKIIAIAAQERNERTLSLIQKSNWPFEVYFDPDYNLFRQLSLHYKEGQIIYVFPTMFIFDKDYKLIDKLEGAKEKLKVGAKFPNSGETITEDIFDIDMEFYYAYFKKMKVKK